MRSLLPSDPRRVGRYRMLARLGIGGMGRVFLGSGPDGRLVALKQVSEDWLEDSGFRDRFRGEVAASRKVAGGYTAAVIDADPEAPMPWLASEFVSGITLADAVTGAGPLPEAEVLRLAAGLAAALSVIHRADLVHRDLKPSNIMLTDDGLRVIDFGIARATDNPGAGFTRTGRVMGTVGHMSPEQAEGRDVTPASDVFCLGTVLAMACTGSGPFDGNSDMQTMYNVVHNEPNLERVPPRVRDLVARCLAKQPQQRPDTAWILESIGELNPTKTPWPQPVHGLIAQLRGEVDAAVNAPNWGTGLVGRMVDRTRAFTAAPPGQQRRPAAEAVNDWYSGAEKQFRKLLTYRRDHRDKAAGADEAAAAEPTPGRSAEVRAKLLRFRDPGIIVLGTIAGMFVASDLNIGAAIASDRQSLGIGGGEIADASSGIGGQDLVRALTHPGYFGALAGFLMGGCVAALLRAIVGKRSQRFGRITLAVAAALGFVIGWLAEHEYVKVQLISIGVRGDLTVNETDAALVMLGVLMAFIALGCALWVIGRAIPVLAMVGFLPAVAVGAAWAYVGATGFVVDDWLSLGVASIIGGTVGGGVAARVLNTIADRKAARQPHTGARAW